MRFDAIAYHGYPGGRPVGSVRAVEQGEPV